MKKSLTDQQKIWRRKKISKSLKEEVRIIAKEKPSPEEKARLKSESKKHKHERTLNNHLFPRKKAYILLLIAMGIVAAVFLFMLILVESMPSDLMAITIGTLFVLLFITSVMLGREKKYKRAVGIVLAMIFLVVFGASSYFLGTTYAMLQNISVYNPKGVTNHTDKDVTQEAFNIYITGIDQWESEKGEDLERSDVNMVLTIHPQTKKVLLTSIPRDTYVMLHSYQAMDKLTHSGIYGVEETIKTVEDWFDIKLDYYVKMNFSATRNIINMMDGIDVYSPIEFESSIMGYKYKKGWNHLYGKQALYFARERKSFEGQDYIRVENQQRVVKAVIKKMTSSTTLLTKYGDIMRAARDNLETDMPSEDMVKLVKMQLTDLSEWSVDSQKIEGSPDKDYVASLTQQYKFDIFRADEESVKSCVKNIKQLMSPSEQELQMAKESKSKSFAINFARSLKEKIEDGLNNDEETSEEEEE